MSFINDLSFCKVFDVHEIIVYEAELFLRPYLLSYLPTFLLLGSESFLRS